MSTPTEREAFEAWFREIDEDADLKPDNYNPKWYDIWDTQYAWLGYQAGRASQVAAPSPQQRDESKEPLSWSELLAIANIPNVEMCLENFSHDSTEDNAGCLVQAIINAYVAQERTS